MSAQNRLNEVATGKAKNPIAEFSGFLEKFKPQMALALPKHLTPDRMARLAVTAFSTTPKLQECDPKTIIGAIMTASMLGLEINVDGQGFLVPYGKTCQFVPGWKGLVDLVNRSGAATVYTGVIFKDQQYTFSDGSSRELIIHNETDLDAPEDITHAYAIGWVKGAERPHIELWRVSKIRKHRDRYNKQGTKHYSFRDWEMYARKIPLLQVIKYIPKSIELRNAAQVAEAVESGQHAVIDGEFISVTEQDETLPETPPKANATPMEEVSLGDQIRRNLKASKDVDVLDAHADLINELANKDEADELTKLYKELRAKLAD